MIALDAAEYRSRRLHESRAIWTVYSDLMPDEGNFFYCALNVKENGRLAILLWLSCERKVICWCNKTVLFLIADQFAVSQLFWMVGCERCLLGDT